MKKHLLTFLAIGSLLLSGCVSGSDAAPQVPQSTKAPGETPPGGSEEASATIPSGPLAVSEVILPSFMSQCGSQERLIRNFESGNFEEAFSALQETAIEADTLSTSWRERRILLAGGVVGVVANWADNAKGVALVATRDFAMSSEFEFLSGLEGKNRAQFSTLVDRVFESILLECQLEELYLSTQLRFDQGQVLVAEIGVAVQELRPVPTRTVKAADLTKKAWTEYGSLGIWRFGKDCSNSIGSCTSGDFNFDAPCSSVFVEVNFINDSGVYYSAIDSLRNVKVGEKATFKLQAIGQATSFRLSKVTCF